MPAFAFFYCVEVKVMSIIKNRLCPDFFCHSLTDIEAEWIKSRNIKTICLDIDNTITEHDGMSVSGDILQWVSEMRESGINLFLISNNSEERVIPLARNIGIEYIAKAGKPGAKKILSKLGKKSKNSIFVGDQIFTDILCGKRCGMTTILVDPISEEKLFQIKLKRKVEKLVSIGWDREKNMIERT